MVGNSCIILPYISLSKINFIFVFYENKLSALLWALLGALLGTLSLGATGKRWPLFGGVVTNRFTSEAHASHLIFLVMLSAIAVI